MPEHATDPRTAIYNDFHHNFMPRQEQANRHSAEVILPMVFQYLRPASVLDVGCGAGTWLAVCRDLGVNAIQGVEGPWLDQSQLVIPTECVRIVDLESAFDTGRRYDLAISTEVAEHLSPGAAQTFLSSLARHSDVVLFSAAIPFQPGHHHVNEQFPDYWASLFQSLGYVPIDFIRREIWQNNSIILHFRQNLMLFVKRELVAGDGPFAQLQQQYGPLSIVHPAFYVWRLQQLLEVERNHNTLIQLLRSGTQFQVTDLGNGQLNLARIR